MRTVTVTWRPDDEAFDSTGTHASQVIRINAPHEADSPHAPTGFSPTELLLAGAGSCAAWDVIEILRKKRVPPTALEVVVAGEQAPDPPWAYRTVTLHFIVHGIGLEEEHMRRAVELGTARYCSVLASIRGVAEVRTSYAIVPEDALPAAD